MPSDAKFTKKTIDFLKTAGEQTSALWLPKNKKEHEAVLIEPLRTLAFYLADELARDPKARGYKFPRRGFGRLKRASFKVAKGHPAYRDFVHLKASRPSNSMFDENPGLYFFISPDHIFAGAGLYEPSSRQIKQIRAWLADDPAELKSILKSKGFKSEFPDGMETDKVLKTFPRFYPPTHPRIEWLRLQAYYVTREFTKKEFYSADFKDLLLENWKQGLRFNEVLHEILAQTPAVMAFAPEAEAVETSDDESSSSEDLWDDRL